MIFRSRRFVRRSRVSAVFRVVAVGFGMGCGA
jgi:hypothetical protein